MAKTTFAGRSPHSACSDRVTATDSPTFRDAGEYSVWVVNSHRPGRDRLRQPPPFTVLTPELRARTGTGDANGGEPECGRGAPKARRQTPTRIQFGDGSALALVIRLSGSGLMIRLCVLQFVHRPHRPTPTTGSVCRACGDCQAADLILMRVRVGSSCKASQGHDEAMSSSVRLEVRTARARPQPSFFYRLEEG